MAVDFAAPPASDSGFRRRRDIRPLVAVGVAVCVALAGLASMLMSRMPATPTQSNPHPPGFTGLKADASRGTEVADLPIREPEQPARSQAEQDARQALRDAGDMIKARRYDQAIGMLTAHQPQLKNTPEAYLLVARALEGKGDHQTARDFYNAAANRDPYFADAYWGFATTSEKLGDLESAIGGMRSFLHVEGGADPYRIRVAQARSAIWEWESRLGRGPWGPTRGVPPGYTAQEIRRDDKGVGIKMQVPGSENETGDTRAEMKSQSKFKIFNR